MIYKASNFRLSFDSATYTGKGQIPSVIIKDSKGENINGSDYSLTWSNKNSKTPGTYTVTITFKGNYSGSKTLSYKIVKASSAVSLTAKSATYTGKAISIGTAIVTGSTGKVTYTYYRDSKCTKKTDTSASYGKASKAGAAPVTAGVYYVKASVAADANYKAATSNAVKLVIRKKANTFSSVTSSKKLKYSTLKTKKQKFTISATVKESAKKTYALSSVPKVAKKYITVSSSGKVTVKKGLKKGAYSIKVKITAGATTNYKRTTVTKNLKIVVK